MIPSTYCRDHAQVVYGTWSYAEASIKFRARGLLLGGGPGKDVWCRMVSSMNGSDYLVYCFANGTDIDGVFT